MADMAKPLHPLVDRVLGGKLVETLAAKRAAGESYDTIARWLETEHAIVVTGETVRSWCSTLLSEASS